MGKALNLTADLISKPLAWGYCAFGVVYYATQYALDKCREAYSSLRKIGPDEIRGGKFKVYLENEVPKGELELLLNLGNRPLWTEKREDPRINLK